MKSITINFPHMREGGRGLLPTCRRSVLLRSSFSLLISTNGMHTSRSHILAQKPKEVRDLHHLPQGGTTLTGVIQMRSSHRRVSEVQTMLLVLVEGSPIEGEPWFSVMFIVLRKDEDRTVEERGETVSICNKQPQLPPWTAVIGSGYRPDYGTRDKRQEKKERDQRGNAQRVLSTSSLRTLPPALNKKITISS
jgi:hypothetical protein